MLTIQGANGPFSFRSGAVGRRCEGDAEGVVRRPTSASLGLLDASGRRTLVRAEYARVTPINETQAIVQRAFGQPNILYELGRGEIGPAPYQGAGRLMGADLSPVVTPVVSAPTTHVFLGGGRVQTLADVTDIMQYPTFVLAHMTRDGAEVSQVFDVAMSTPRSPVVGRVEPWRVAPFADRAPGSALSRGNAGAYPIDLAARAVAPQHPDLPGQLYTPLGADGVPLALPAGAIGVFPLRYHNASFDSMNRRNVAHGWGVVFVTVRGIEIAMSEGRMADVIAQSSSLYRWTGYMRYTRWAAGGEPRPGTQPPSAVHDWTILRDANGRWLPIFDHQQWGAGPASGADAFASREEAVAAAFVVWQANVNQSNLARAQAEAERQAQAARLGAEHWAEIQSGRRRICAADTFVGGLPREGIERYLQQCNVSERYVAQYRSRISAEAFTAASERARREEQEYREEQAQLEYDRFFGGPVSAGDPWAAGLQAMQGAMNRHYDGAIAQQNRVYQQNLSAWNSGAHNWRPQ